ncbi:MAG: aminotransferase class I/II-fold pyridoxal phosphate-dependent enzyme [Anaerolineae bacterium]|nr:aminotransferase class I/II-fold pyridoxal phosphate-dependent enzyme [Anaerolineae bacterium]
MKLPPFQLDRFFDGREQTRFNVAGSVCNQRTVNAILSLEPDAWERLLNLELEYQAYSGHPHLKAAIADIYGTPIKSANIMVSTGSQEGIFALLHTLLEQGDRVIVQKPCYQQLAQIAESLGCEVISWGMSEDEVWKVDLDFLATQAIEGTKLIVINSPHNPTGFQFTQQEFNAVIEIARKQGIYLLSDEVFRFLEPNDSDHLPAAAEVYERAISVSDMSKTYGMPGARVGWLVTQDLKVLTEALTFKDYLTITGNAVGQFLSTIALRHYQIFIETNRLLLSENLDYFYAFMKRNPNRVAWAPPRAGTTAFIRYCDGTDTDELAENLYTKSGVLVAPSSKFNYGHHHIRIGYGSPTFKEAMQVFEDYLMS